MAKKKKGIKVKEPVRIREKVLGDGTISLYLDMYHKGNRKKEGLKLYIIPETTPAAKLQNINTRKLAEQVKAQRILDIHNDSTGTEGRVRIGNFDILSSSTGALSLESAGWEGGRLLTGTGDDKILFHITDHLGSVRVIKDGTGTVRQRFDYYPFGCVSKSWFSSSNPPQPTLRYRFSGKEIAGQKVNAGLVIGPLAGTPAAAAGTPYLDFGARLYDPRSAAWLSQDPLAEKYYHISPYVYCAGNPVNLVDLEGRGPVLYRILSGVISAGADFGIQIGVKMLEGDNFNGAFKKVDWTSVGGSLVTGLVDPKKALGKVVIGVVSVADAAIDSSIDDRFRVVGHPDEEKAKSVADAAIDLSVGLSGVAGGEKVAKVVEDGFNKEAENKAIATLTKQGMQQARYRAKIAAKEGVKIAEKQVVSLSAKGVGEVGKQMLVEPEKEPLRLQFQQGYNYNPSSFGYVF